MELFPFFLTFLFFCHFEFVRMGTRAADCMCTFAETKATMAANAKDYIVVQNGYDELYIPRHQILYVRGSVAHGSGDSFMIRLVNGEEIEQKGFAAFRERMKDAEKIFPE
jgi:hypothetical protein